MRSRTSARNAGSASAASVPGRHDEGRRHGVDGDVVLAPLDGQALRQVRDGRLGHAVDRLARQRHGAGLRAEVDDPAVALADHHAARRLAGEEGALEVHGERESKSSSRTSSAGFSGADAGVVDQDVERPKRGDRLLDGGSIWSRSRDVHLQRQRAAADRLDLVASAAAGRDVAQAERDVGARVGEGQRDRPPIPRAAPVTSAT